MPRPAVWAVVALLAVTGAAVAVSALSDPAPQRAGGAAPQTSSSVDGGDAPATTSTEPGSSTIPESTTTTLPDGPVTIVGESLTLSAAEELEARLGDVTIDAEVGRSFARDLAALEQLAEEGRLGEVVVVHVGNNDAVADGGFEQIYDLVDGRRLIVMTVSVPREWESQVNESIDAFTATHPDVEVIDWKSETVRDPDLLVGDRVHLSEEGIERYAEIVADTVMTP